MHRRPTHPPKTAGPQLVIPAKAGIQRGGEGRGNTPSNHPPRTAPCRAGARPQPPAKYQTTKTSKEKPRRAGTRPQPIKTHNRTKMTRACSSPARRIGSAILRCEETFLHRPVRNASSVCVRGELLMIEQRVTQLEAGHKEVVENVVRLTENVNAGFTQMHERFEQMDERFEQMDERLERLETNVTDIKAILLRIENRLDKIEGPNT